VRQRGNDIPTALFKFLSVENFVSSYKRNYLHLQRIDEFNDGIAADPFDGMPLLVDQKNREPIYFQFSPTTSLSDIDRIIRQRSYSFCLTKTLGKVQIDKFRGNDRNKIAIEFDGPILLKELERIFWDECNLNYGAKANQIFRLSAGSVDYVDINTHSLDTEFLSSAEDFMFVKDGALYRDEDEYRIGLICNVPNKSIKIAGSSLSFPASLEMPFDLKNAISIGVIREIHSWSECSKRKLAGIVA